MEKDNVIQKIQKLLKLQYNAKKIGSTGEAYQAAKMVRKLLMEYNLSMSDIDTSDGEQKGYNVEYILFADNTVMNKFFRSYLEGVPVGLQENYDSLKPTSAETALVVCHQEAIDEYVKENFTMNDKKPRTRTRKIYGDAYNLGAADGRAVSLNRQIAQTPKEGLLFDI